MPGVVVFGTSFGCLTHVRALREAGFDVLAVVGQDPTRTAERAKRFDVPLGLTSADEAFSLPGLDAISIATPPATHHDLVLTAAAAGKHVLCEKPFAMNRREAEAMRDAAKRAGVVHLLATEFRYSPPNALMAQTVQSGRIGDPIDGLFSLDVPFVSSADAGGVPSWWHDASQSGGWLGAWGVHVIDQIRTTLGEIESLSGFISTRDDRLKGGADEGFNALLRTESGASVTLRSSARSLAFGSSTRIIGSEATVVLEGDQVQLHSASGMEVLAVPPNLEVLPPRPPPTEGLGTAYEHGHAMGTDFGPFTRLGEVFLGLIEGRDVSQWPRPATFDDGIANQGVMDAIRSSSAHRGRQERLG
jgi:predicted dehydrogenase